MKRSIFLVFAILALASVQFSQASSPAPDAAELTKMLTEFLDGATRNDPAAHEKFWAEDLIYTRGAGTRTTKAEIMRGVRSAPAPKPEEPKAVFTAEDIQVKQYGTIAIVPYRLVATLTDKGVTRVSKYYATAVLLKRGGKWQTVSYQVTPIPEPKEEPKK